MMFNNSININKANNHFSTQTIEHEKDHDIEFIFFSIKLIISLRDNNNVKCVLKSMTGFTSQHFCDCPKSELGFPFANVVVLFMLNELRREVVVCFLDIGGIVLHNCLIFPFIIMFDFYFQNG